MMQVVELVFAILGGFLLGLSFSGLYAEWRAHRAGEAVSLQALTPKVEETSRKTILPPALWSMPRDSRHWLN